MVSDYELLSLHEADSLRLTPKDLSIIYKKDRLQIRKELNQYIPQRLNTQRFTENHFLFEDMNTKRDWWLLGLVTSDGSITKNSFKVISKDMDLLKKIQQIIPESIIGLNNGNVYEITIRSNIASERLQKLGLNIGKKSHKIKPLTPPKEFLGDYARGLFDGDGSVNIRTRGIYSVNICGSSKTCEFFRDKIFKSNNAISKCHNSFITEKGAMIGNPKKWFYDLYNLLYDPCTLSQGIFLERKYIKFLEIFSTFNT